MSDELSCQSFVFFDLETTGLIRQEADGGRTRVTEMSFIRIAREELSKIQSDLPRVLHKLTVTMNPQKNLTEQVFKLTGLNNELLSNEEPFDEKKAALIKCFLQQCKPPVCLVAHNGFKFDLPLLKEELIEFPNTISEDTRCVDTLYAFRALMNNSNFNQFISGDAEPNGSTSSEVEPGMSIRSNRVTTVSFVLPKVYYRLFGSDPPGSHRAEHDVETLIKCCLRFGQPLLEYFDNHWKRFSSVERIYDDKV